MLQVQARLQATSITPDALTLIAHETTKYSAADLEAIVKEARLLARLAGHIGIHWQDARESALQTLAWALGQTVDALLHVPLDKTPARARAISLLKSPPGNGNAVASLLS